MYSTVQHSAQLQHIILQYNDIQYSTIQRQYYILLHIYITIRYFKYIIVLHIKVSSIVIQYSMYNIGMYRKCRKKVRPNIVQYYTVHYSTLSHNTDNTVLHSKVTYSTKQYIRVQYYIVHTVNT